jgi:tRNA threonylcarbamoyladenosine biosynthesis protein TsaE
MKAYHIKTINDIHITAKQFLDDFGHHQVFAFYGPMGSGKTTFIKAVCNILKVEDDVTSPSFSMLNAYFPAGDKHICHYDFYRIEKPAEILHTGFYEYLDMADMIFIEWPENAESILPTERVNVNIDYQGDGRVMTAKHNN